MPESRQHTLDRVRKPRVHITYDVEVGNATVKKDIPFVVGVMGDFSGNPTQKLKPLKDRKFVAIDRDNFNEVLASMTPGLNMKVENTLEGDGSELSVELKFKSMDDFSPARVAEQVEPLQKLMETRDQLKQLQAMADRDDSFEELLDETIRKTSAGKDGE